MEFVPTVEFLLFSCPAHVIFNLHVSGTHLMAYILLSSIPVLMFLSSYVL
jgi:hypothetical protein